MDNFTVTFFKHLVDSTGHQFKALQEAIDVRSESQEEALRVAQQHFARHRGILDWSLHADALEIVVRSGLKVQHRSEQEAHDRQKDESQASFDRDPQVNAIRACNDRARFSATARGAFAKTRSLAPRHRNDSEILPTNGTPRRQSSTGFDAAQRNHSSRPQ